MRDTRNESQSLRQRVGVARLHIGEISLPACETIRPLQLPRTRPVERGMIRVYLTTGNRTIVWVYLTSRHICRVATGRPPGFAVDAGD